MRGGSTAPHLALSSLDIESWHGPCCYHARTIYKVSFPNQANVDFICIIDDQNEKFHSTAAKGLTTKYLYSGMYRRYFLFPSTKSKSAFSELYASQKMLNILRCKYAETHHRAGRKCSRQLGSLGIGSVLFHATNSGL